MKRKLILLSAPFLLSAMIAATLLADADAIAILPLDEGAGTVAGDESGLGNDGTLVNGAAFEANTGDGSPYSVRFDGVDDYIDLGVLDVNGTGLTLAAWFNADSFPGPSRDPRIISKASGTASSSHVFMLGTIRSSTETRLRARVRVGGSTTTLIASSGNLAAGVWQHAAVTYDGVTLRLYLDGVEVGNTPLSGAVDVDPSLPVTVGSQPPGAGNRFFDGLLDDVRILQRALSAEELAAIVSSNPPPVAVDDGYSTDEDTTLVVPAATGLLFNDVDNNPPDDLTAVLLTNPASGSLTNFGVDGSFTYVPDPDFNGLDSFTYEAVDGQDGPSGQATVTLTVNVVNDAPVAVDDSYETPPDTTLVVDGANGVLENDSDTDQDPLEAVLVENVSNGVLNLQADGSFDYLPNAGFSGQDSFTYRANDSLFDSNLATATILVLVPPSAVDDEYSTDEDKTLVVPAATGLLLNDVDNNLPDDLTAVLLTNPAKGSLANFGVDGGFTYEPDPDFNGLDSFTYEAVDGQNGTGAQATVTLAVNAVNDAPVAVDDGYEMPSDTTLVVDDANGVLENDSDADQDPLQAVLVENVSNGVLNLQPDGSFDYTPDAGFSGQDSFTYQANDSLLDSNLATVTISLGGDPDAVAILPLDEGAGTVAGDESGLGNDGALVNGAAFEADSGDGSPYSVRFDGVDDYIDLGMLDVDGTGLTLAAWLNADSFPGPSRDPRIISKASGTSSNDHVFMLGTIRSGTETRLRARVRVGGSTTTLIASSGDLATGVWQHAAVTYDGVTLRLYLDGVEVGNRPLSGAVDMDPSIPVTVGSQPPGAGDRFFDGLLDDVRILQRALSADELAAIVSGDPPPVAVDDGYSTDEDTTLVVPAATGLLSNDVDNSPLDDLTAVLLTNPANGSLTNFGLDGSFTYVPDPDFNGLDSFTYEAVDSQNGPSGQATVTLTVNAVNDAPVAVDDGYETPPDTVLVVDAANGVLENDTDPDLDPLQAGLVEDVSNGVLNLQTDGSFDYTPNAGFSGQDSFTYRANDSLLDSNSATVTFLVLVLVPPSAVDDEYSTDEDTTLVVPAATGLLSNDVDNSPPDDLTAVLLTNPANGSLTNFGVDGSFTYVPDPDFNGLDSFTYEAVDSQNGPSGQATVTLTVNAVNDAPVAVDDGYETPPDTVLVVDAANGVLENDTDPDLDLLQAVLVADVSNGVLNLQADGSFDYTPNAGFSGQDSFTYRANDSLLDSNLATVIISMGADNGAPQLVTGQIVFTKQVIDDAVDQTHFVQAADFTGDNLIDVVATDYVDDSLFWYENDGNGGFVTRILDANLDGAYPADVADVDLDGDIDVLAAGYLADTYVWYENDGHGGFTRHDIDTAANGAHSIVTGDMDLDGDIDLLTANQDGRTIAWYENDGVNSFTLHIINSTSNGAKRAEMADFDGDGDIDVATASYFLDEIAWYENDGNQIFTKRIIDSTADGAYYVSPADIDGDGDADLLAASKLDNTIAWYENLGAGSFNAHTIDDEAMAARSVIGADIDGDGDFDALSASVDDDTVAWYENDGSGGFTAHEIDDAADGAYGIFAIDMDNDGDVDVLSASGRDRTIALHYHSRAHTASVEFGGTLVVDTTALQTVDPDSNPANLIYTLTNAPDFGELQLGGVPVPMGGAFTQADIDSDRITYLHYGVISAPDSFSFRVEDGGESGVRPDGSFTIIVEESGGDIVRLPLDEGAGTVAGDVSGLGNDGLLVNGAVFETNTGDGSPYAVRFDGVDDYIDLGALDVNGTGLTLAAWFNADSFPGLANDPRIISKASGVSSNEHLFMLGTIRSGSGVRLRARVRIDGSTTTLIAGSGDLATGLWQHAAATYDGVTLWLYLDGEEVGSTPLSGAVDIDPSLPVTVGSQPPGAGGNFFDGLLDDVRILQRALRADEIALIASGEN